MCSRTPRSRSFSSVLFPVGLLLAIYAVWKTREGLLTALLAADVFIYIYGIWGLPDWLCRLTLMSRATTGRRKLAVGMIEPILIFRSVAELRLARVRCQNETAASEAGEVAVAGQGSPKRRPLLSRPASAMVVCLVAAFLIGVGAGFSSTFPLRMLYLVMLVLVVFFMLAGLWGVVFGRAYARQVLISSLVVVVLAGGCMNPVQQGAQTLVSSPVISMVQSKILYQDSTDGEEVAVLADDTVIGQALIANGVPAVNSLNALPALDRWHRIDPNARQERIYNRYAYIDAEVTGKKTSTFWYISTDHFGVRLAVDDLPKVGVTHILTKKKLDTLSSSKVHLEKLGKTDEWSLYKIERVKGAD